MYLNKEQADALRVQHDKRKEYEKKKLEEWGYAIGDDKYVINGKEYTQVRSDAYHQAVCKQLEKAGWKDITFFKRWGKLEWNKPIEKWAGFQSPKTKKLYNFLEAERIVEDDWDEDKHYAFCSSQTLGINLLVENFVGDELRTWLYLGSARDNRQEPTEVFFTTWEEVDGKIIEGKRKINLKDMKIYERID